MLARNALDLFRHGRGEQRCLAGARRLLENPLHVVDKAHAQHLIGFIQHQAGDLIELKGAALDVVGDAPGSTYDHVHAPPQRLDLAVVLLAAVDRQDVKISQVSRVALKGFGDLNGQLPGGGQRQDLHSGRLQIQPGQQRQGKGRRLAGARGGVPQQILAVQQQRNGLGLNRRRGFVAQALERFQQRFGQVQTGESGGCGVGGIVRRGLALGVCHFRVRVAAGTRGGLRRCAIIPEAGCHAASISTRACKRSRTANLRHDLFGISAIGSV